MSKSRRDGLYLLVMGIVVFVLFGFMFRFVAKDAMADFKLVYYGTNCLQHHCDPYRESELRSFYRTESVESLACIIREDTTEGALGDMRSPKALLSA